MPWTALRIDSGGRPAIALLDRRFEATPPSDQLPRLAWFGVWCRRSPPDGALWDPDETAALEQIESDLIHLANQHGRGWAVYVRCLSTYGIWEYYLYTGPDVNFALVLGTLRERHPEFRIEYDHRDDPDCSQYTRWLAESGEALE